MFKTLAILAKSFWLMFSLQPVRAIALAPRGTSPALTGSGVVAATFVITSSYTSDLTPHVVFAVLNIAMYAAAVYIFAAIVSLSRQARIIAVYIFNIAVIGAAIPAGWPTSVGAVAVMVCAFCAWLYAYRTLIAMDARGEFAVRDSKANG